VRNSLVVSIVAVGVVLGSAGALHAGKRVKRTAVDGASLVAPPGWKLDKLADGTARLVAADGAAAWRFFPAESVGDFGVWFDAAWTAITSAHSNVQTAPPEVSDTKTGLKSRAAGGIMVDAAGNTRVLFFVAVHDGKRALPMVIEVSDVSSIDTVSAAIDAASDTIELSAKKSKRSGKRATIAQGGWGYALDTTAAPAAQPAAPTAPAAAPAPSSAGTGSIVGRWSVNGTSGLALVDPATGAWSMSGGEGEYWTFDAKGNFEHGRLKQLRTGRCTSMVWSWWTGTYRASGDTLVVTPKKSKGKFEGECGTDRKYETTPSKDKTTYAAGLVEQDGIQWLVLVEAGTKTRTELRREK